VEPTGKDREMKTNENEPTNRFGELLLSKRPGYCRDARCDIGDCQLEHTARQREDAERRQDAAERDGWS
jgi:hypothetical protein